MPLTIQQLNATSNQPFPSSSSSSSSSQSVDAWRVDLSLLVTQVRDRQTERLEFTSVGRCRSIASQAQQLLRDAETKKSSSVSASTSTTMTTTNATDQLQQLSLPYVVTDIVLSVRIQLDFVVIPESTSCIERCANCLA